MWLVKMRVTKHAEQRARERLGIPTRAVARMAAAALADGAPHSAFAGSMKRYLDSVFFSHGNATNMRVFNQHLFIFSGEKLITAWALPAKYRNAALNAAR